MRLLRTLALTTALVLTALPALAQAQPDEAATLIADSVQLAQQNRLVANGNVEVLYRGTRMKAREITYDRASGALQIAGPITLSDDKGVVILADQAQLSDDLRNGILQSARMVMDEQLQLAAVEMQRIDGRHTVMSKVVASSCQVCAARPTPLWEIRARAVVHDQLERQIYFDNAQLRFGGVPVLWLPYMRIPDPSLARADGFLMPSFYTSSRRGTGVALPYFMTLGPSRDLTLTPSLATKNVQSLGFRYRQAVERGTWALTGALSHDDILTGRRGWLATEGHFAVGAGFELRFAGEMISDPAYFRDYGLTDKDRLESHAVISRVRRNEYIAARISHTHSIREGEINSQLPQLSGDAVWTGRHALPGVGGIATLGLDLHAHQRSSKLDVLGRDVRRSSVSAYWRRDWQLPSGIIAAFETGAALDLHHVSQDSRWNGRSTTFSPSAMVELRWPWARVDGAGNTDVIEPVVQFVASRLHRASAVAGSPGHVPNEDSVLVEFDEGNLFGLNRYPGADRREGGKRINAGLSWTRNTATGWHVIANAGRIFRFDGQEQFSPKSGLAGKRSDWLASLHMQMPNGAVFQGRAVFDEGFTLSRGEMRLAVERERYGLAAGWLWAEADPLELRATDTSEWVFDGRWRMTDAWTANAAARYDFGSGHATAAQMGLGYETECLRVDVTLNRRFTGTGALRPTTDFGLSLDLLGFGGAKSKKARSHSCGI